MAREIKKFNRKEENGNVTPCYEITCSSCGLKNEIPIELLNAFSGLYCSFCGRRLNL